MLWLLRLLTRAVHRWFGARRILYPIRAGSLVVYRIGPEDGDPWVLVHGLGATTLSFFTIIRALRRNCHLVLVEMSELGGSRTPAGGLSVSEAVESLAAMITDFFPGRKVTLAGISLGGWMVTRLAMKRPDLVEKLVLINAGGFDDQDWERIQNLVDVRNLGDVDQLYGALFNDTPFYMALARRGFLRAYQSPAVRQVTGSITPADGFTRADLERLEMPVALIWGENDGLFTVEVAREMERAIPKGKLFVLEKCGHAAQWDNPRALASAVKRFQVEAGNR